MTRYIFILLMAACLQAGEWNQIGTVTETVSGEVTQLTWLKNSLYVRGTINRIGSLYPSQHMARWNSGTWYDVGSFTTAVQFPNYASRPGGSYISQWDASTKSLFKYRIEDNYTMTMLSAGVGNGAIMRVNDTFKYDWFFYTNGDNDPHAKQNSWDRICTGSQAPIIYYDNATTPYAKYSWSMTNHQNLADADGGFVYSGTTYFLGGVGPGVPTNYDKFLLQYPGWNRGNNYQTVNWPVTTADGFFSFGNATPYAYVTGINTTLTTEVPTPSDTSFGDVATQCFSATRILSWHPTLGFRYVVGSLAGVTAPGALPDAGSCVSMVWLDSPARIYAASASHVYWTDATGTWTQAATVSGGQIRCLATGPNGSIFVGGDFTGGDFGAGSPRIGFIMATNGLKYGVPGGGVNDGRVSSIVYDSTSGVMVLGGTFTTVGSANYPYACLATLNPAPVDVSMVPAAIDETAVVGTVAGTLTAQDPTSSGISYSLVSGTGSDDNALFGISGSNLVTAGALDYETKATYLVRIRAAESGNPTAYIERAFTVTISDANDLPTGITLSNSSVSEGQANATVGTMSANDPDTGDTHTFELVVGAVDNAAFSIVGNVLKTGVALDFETGGATRTVRIKVTDSAGGTRTVDLTIDVIDVTTDPNISAIANVQVVENTTSPQIAFTVSDSDTPLNSLTINGTSSNASLVPNSGITFGGTGSSRYVVVTPGRSLLGTAPESSVISITVSDGTQSATAQFRITYVTSRPFVRFGYKHLLFRDGQARVWICGDNASGQFGNGTNTSSTTLTRVPALEPFTNYRAGWLSTWVVDQDGKAYATGQNALGELGLGTAVASTNSLQLVTDQVEDVYPGSWFSLIRKSDGRLLASGTNTAKSLSGHGPHGNGAPNMGNYSFAYYLFNPGGNIGDVYLPYPSYWQGTFGAFGQRNVSSYNDFSTAVALGATDAGAGYGWSIYQTSTSTYVAGAYMTSTYGAGNSYSIRPIISNGMTGSYVTSTGGYVSLPQYPFTYANAMDNVDCGPLSYIYLNYFQIPKIPNDSRIIPGQMCVYVISSTGQLSVMGQNQKGQLGVGDYSPRFTLTDVPGMTSVADVAGGVAHTILLKQDGTVWVCGTNLDGALGTGTNDVRNTFTQVPGFANVKAIAAGFQQSAIVDANGHLWVSGLQSSGQLGVGNTTTLSTYAEIVVDPPSDIAVSPASVIENANDVEVGAISCTSGLPSPVITYSLVSGTGSTDNAKFTIVANKLRTTSSANLDYETGSQSRSIRVRATDQYKLYFEKVLTITITNGNDAPTDVSLTPNGTVTEALSVGGTIGTLGTTDPDSGDTFTYSLVSGTGSTDNAFCSISGSGMLVAQLLDADAPSGKTTRAIRVRATDAGGLWFEKAITFNVTAVNEAPRTINLSSSTVTENAAAGTAIGQVTCTDDESDLCDYTLLEVKDQAGTVVSGIFQLNFGTNSYALVKSGSATIDYETNRYYDLTIQGAERAPGTGNITRTLRLTVTNVDEMPTAVSLSPAAFREDIPTSTNGVRLMAVDPESTPQRRFSYSIIQDPSSKFQVVSVNYAQEDGVYGYEYWLRVTTALNYEAQSSYPLRLRVSDSSGGTVDLDVVVPVGNVNEPPANVSLSASSILEGADAGTDIGTLSATDPDAGDTVTFTLDASAPDNASFLITGSTLKSNAIFDRETKSSYSVVVKATDTAGLVTNQTFAISIANVNEPITNLTLSNSLIAENNAIGASIGTLAAVDVDAGDTATFALDAGVADNDVFTLQGTLLKAAVVFDTETKSSYTVRVRATDSGGLTFQKDLVVTVGNVNETPTDVVLTGGTVAETSSLPAIVGTLSAVDPDAGGTYSFALVSGSGSTHNSMFAISGTGLQLLQTVDFETQPTLSVRVRVTDNGGLTLEKALTVTVTNGDEAPTNILLSQSSISEASPSGTVVGLFTTVDGDVGDTATFALVSGTGSTDNASFIISGSALVLATALDYESKQSYSIRVRATDSTGLTADRVMTITVNNVNEAPTGITPSSTAFLETIGTASPVCTFTATDQDVGETFTYSLVSGGGATDNSAFIISSNGLYLASGANYEQKQSYSIRVRVADSGGRTFERSLSLTVQNVNEAPSSVAISSDSVLEESATDTTVGSLTAIDEDAGDSSTYELYTPPSTSNDNASFTLTGNILKTAAVFDYETKSSYTVVIRATDTANNQIVQVLTISIAPRNLPPTDIALSNSSVEETTAIDAIIGTLSATDPNGWDSHTFSLPAGNPSNVNFSISTNRLKLARTLDYETSPSLTITIRATDSYGATFDKQFTITVVDRNDAPSNMSLTPASIRENQTVGTQVGIITISDQDATDVENAFLVPGEGSDDNALFVLETVAGQNKQIRVRTNAVFDFEQRQSFTIRVRAVDSAGALLERVFTIACINVNEAPTAFTIDRTVVPENSVAGTNVGTFSAIDPDVGDTFTFTLVPGEGDTDNADFETSGNALKTASIFDFENKATYSIRIRCEDASGAYVDQIQTVTVSDVKEPPFDLTLGSNQVTGGAAIGTTIGTLTAFDQDANSTTFSYTLPIGKANNSRFSVTGNTLKSASSFTFDRVTPANNQFTVRVRVTDATGLYLEREFVVEVVDPDQNVAPTDITLSTTDLAEGRPTNTTIATLSAIDPNPGDSHIFQLVSGSGDNDNGSFSIVGTDLRNSVIFNAATKNTYRIRIKATDDRGLALTKTFLLNVISLDYDVTIDDATVAENQPTGTQFGSFVVKDTVGDGGPHTVAFVAGSGDEGNTLFDIVQDNGTYVLETKQSFDYESRASYSIRVRITDSGGATLDKSLGITITNANDAPTCTGVSRTGTEDIVLNGTVTGADVDGDSLSYYVATQPAHGTATVGSGGSWSYYPQGNFYGNDSFTIVATDGELESAPATVSVSIRAAQDAPILYITDTMKMTAISTLDSTSSGDRVTAIIASSEANASDAIVDPDANPQEGLAIVGSTGSDKGNWQFSLDDGTSWTTLSAGVMPSNAMLLPSTSTTRIRFVPSTRYVGTLQLTLRAWDRSQGNPGSYINVDAVGTGGSTPFSTAFTTIDLAVFDPDAVNVAPTDITLSNAAISSLLPPNTEIGLLATADANPSDTFTYSLVSGTGSTNNDKVWVSGNKLLAKMTTTTGTINCRLRSTDNRGLWVETALVITVSDTTWGFTINNAAVAENAAPAKIGDIIIVDTLGNAPYTLELVSGGGLEVGGSESTFWLNSTQVFDHEQTPLVPLTLRLTDSTARVLQQSFYIEIQDRNDRPSAATATASVAEDAQVIIPLSGSDQDGQTLTYTVTVQPAHGTVLVSGAQVTYAPEADFTGTDTFSYVASDGTLASDPALVSATVTPIQDAPTLYDTSRMTMPAISKNAATNSGVTVSNIIDSSPANSGNAITDPDAGAVEGLAVISQTTLDAGYFQFSLNGGSTWTSFGSVSSTNALCLAANPATRVRFVPLGSITGTANLLVRAWDQTTGTNGGRQNLDVAGIGGTAAFSTAYVQVLLTIGDNSVPRAESRAIVTAEDTAASATLTAVDDDGDTLTYETVAGPTKGTLEWLDTHLGTCRYTPRANANGADSFTYRVRDAASASQAATVSITITPVNDNPTATNQAVTVYTLRPRSGQLDASDPDGDTLQYLVVSQPVNAVVAVNANTGAYTITTNVGVTSGSDSFTWRAQDPSGTLSNLGTVTITYTDQNSSPVILDTGSITAYLGWATIGTFLATDAEGDTVTWQITSAPSHGALTLNATSGAYSYQPTNGTLATTDSFAIVANDGVSNSQEQTISVIIDRTDYQLLVRGQNLAMLEDGIVTGTVVADTRVGGAVSFTVQTDPAHGSLSINGSTGAFTYTPAANYAGVDQFWVVASQNGDLSNAAKFTLAIASVNDEPTFLVDPTVTVLEDSGANVITSFVRSISPGGGADEAGQALTFTIANTNPTLFSVAPAISAEGHLSFTPTADANGSSTVRVTLSDNGGTANGGDSVSIEKTYTIIIAPVNDAPSFTGGSSATVPEDSGNVVIPGWATNISAGPANESHQVVAFRVTTDRSSLFASGPSVRGDGALVFTPATDQYGSAQVTVKAIDDANAGGAWKESPPVTITITVTPVNDTPTFTAGSNLTVLEDAAIYRGAWATQIRLGPANETADIARFEVSVDTPGLFSEQPAITENGTLSFKPAADANGVAHVTVVLRDGPDNTAGASAPAIFTVTVSSVNDAPSPVAGNGPRLNGIGLVGQMLQATVGIWSDPEGDAITYSFQWIRSDSVDGTYTTIAGSTTGSYTPTAADSSKWVGCLITGRDAGNGQRSALATMNDATGGASGMLNAVVAPTPLDRIPVLGRSILFRSVRLTGTVSPAPSGLVVNGAAIPVNGGSWTAVVALPENGNTTISIHDNDPAIEVPPTTIQVEAHTVPVGGG